MSQNKLLRELRRESSKQGLEITDVSQKKSGHFAITFSDGEQTYCITTSSTPTNADYAVNNILADVRRIKKGSYS